MRDFLYIRNFAPDRWPIGNPYDLEDPNLVDPGEITEIIRTNGGMTPGRTARQPYSDMDAGPTKLWLLVNRNTEDVRPKF